ncbi:hypothetical protein ZHAS_00005703 [Anopheles sinensis]|uniref:Uncharacterized protein n=1 Tax=Anopheles sinensis TaxID=74873 RepID=A0A084VK55_ANOSI|nr:hypothetical protein ZHAS_00005703 [Anopheles sinensis]
MAFMGHTRPSARGKRTSSSMANGKPAARKVPTDRRPVTSIELPETNHSMTVCRRTPMSGGRPMSGSNFSIPLPNPPSRCCIRRRCAGDVSDVALRCFSDRLEHSSGTLQASASENSLARANFRYWRARAVDASKKFD